MVETREITEREILTAVASACDVDQPVETTVYLLPDRIDLNGSTFCYRDDVAGLVKVMRSHGCDLRFGSIAKDRCYLSEYGAVDEVVIPIALGVVGNLTTDLVKAICAIISMRLRIAIGDSQLSEGQFELRIVEMEITPERRIIRGLEFRGSSTDLQSSMEELSGFVEGAE